MRNSDLVSISVAHDQEDPDHSEHYADDFVSSDAFFQENGRKNKYEYIAGLIESGILIKNLDGSAPALRDCLRVTVGRPEENAAFLAALVALL